MSSTSSARNPQTINQPVDPAAADLAASNSLADLAARIRAEHESALLSMQRGLKPAIAAGHLLIEAKAQLHHGQWLPWLAKICPSLPERTAQRYMLFARHAPELEAKSATVADLTMSGALELLAPPAAGPPDLYYWDSISEWAQRHLDAPFNTFDFPDDDLNLDWIQTKLRHQIGLPWAVDWCFSVSDATEDGRPPLRVCPWDDLVRAAKALAPLVSDHTEPKQALKFDFADMRSMQAAIAVVHLDAMWMLGGVLKEMEYRDTISDERYEREWEETHSAVMAQLDAKLAEVRS
jgi:Protein of unknown function (DUF3102)